MKEFVQKPGVRPWHGNELVALQGETLEGLQRFLSPFGSFILDGCDHSGSTPSFTIAPGIVGIEHPTDGYKIARYAGGISQNLGILYLQKNTTQKLYQDGNNHDAMYEYEAVYMDSTDPLYTALEASLGDREKLVIAPAYDTKIDFDWAFKARTLPGWTTVANPNLSATQISGFSIQHRVNIATGQVFIKGTITIKNNLSWLLAKWVPVVDLDVHSLFTPSGEQYLTGTVRYGLGDTVLFDDGNMDLLTTMGLSVHPDGRLFIGARRADLSAATYVVHFNGSYFWT